MQRSRDSEQEYVYTHEANTGPDAQQKTNVLYLHQGIFPVSQSTAAEDILYRRMHVSTCRKQSPHVLRGIRKAHVLQLL